MVSLLTNHTTHIYFQQLPQGCVFHIQNERRNSKARKKLNGKWKIHNVCTLMCICNKTFGYVPKRVISKTKLGAGAGSPGSSQPTVDLSPRLLALFYFSPIAFPKKNVM